MTKTLMDNETLNLRILATSDIHAHLMDFDYYKDQFTPHFGLVRLASLIKEARLEVENTLLLDNGDLIQGNPMGDYLRDYALEKQHPAFILMNELKYDAATLGNHEFNFGLSFLSHILPQANFPYVNANIVDEENTPWIEPFVILERELTTNKGRKVPLKIGIIGVLPPQILLWDKQFFDDYAYNHKRLTVQDITQTIKNYIPLIKAQGADFIIVLAHSGFSSKPYALGAENSATYLTNIEGIDALIAGHTHGAFPANDGELTDINKGLVNGIPCVMPGFWAKQLGVIDCTFKNQNGRWIHTDSSSHLRGIKALPEEFSVDPNHYALLKEAHDLTRKKMSVSIGNNDTEFYSYLSLIQDDACIQIVADSQSHYAKKILEKSEYKHLPLLSAVPIFKVGGRKDNPRFFIEISKGDLAFKDIADLYLYTNQLTIVKVSGHNVKEWLECSASIYHTIDPAEKSPQTLINWEEFRSYNFDVIKGVTYTINPTKPARYNNQYELINEHSERIDNLCFEGKPINETDEFLIVTNHYRGFGEKFPGTGEANVIYLTTDEIPMIITDYIKMMIELEGALKIGPINNWQLNQTALKNTELIFETSATKSAEQYIKNHARYSMQSLGKDTEGFALYKISFL